MPHPYTRTSTPTITYVGERGASSLFRIHLQKEEGLNALLFRGEIAEHLMKQGVRHDLGNVLRGVVLPENPAKRDFFLLVETKDLRVFTDTFEVSGFSPDLVA